MIITKDDELTFRQKLIDLDYQLAIKCLDFIIEQREFDDDRKIHYDGEFYVVKNYYHELSVAEFVMMFCQVEGIENFEQYIVVALTHDMVEDKDVSYSLLQLIGEENFNLVCVLSKNSEQYGGFAEIGKHCVTLLVKICDRFVNCTNAKGIFKKARLARYVVETREMLEVFNLYGIMHNKISITSALTVLSAVFVITERFSEGM